MIKFHIPGIKTHHELNMALIKTIKEHPEYFYDDIEISGVYGCFTPSLFNGGRNINVCYSDEQERKNLIKQYNDLDVGIILTFTNTSLELYEYGDYYCNEDIRSIAERTDINKIIVADEKLKEYITNHYSEYDLKFILSITSEFSNNYSLLKTKEDDYELLVLGYNFNNNSLSLRIKNKNKYELLLNPQCIAKCPYEAEHYKNISDINANKASMDNFFICPYSANDSVDINKLLESKKVITVEDLYNKYVPAGFNVFKINGRTAHDYYLSEYYLYYLVKPEYQDTVRDILSETFDPIDDDYEEEHKRKEDDNK